MLFRKTILLLSVVAFSFMTSCTTRYQDMLRERDERIRELSGDVARLRGENEELQRREAQARDAAATQPKREETNPTDKDELQKIVGNDGIVSYRGGRLSIGVKDSITFDSGSTALKDSSHRVLQNVATALRNSKYGGRRYYIEGHTDNDPIVKTKDKYRSNRHLSSERADAVARYLIEKGVPESSIVVVAYGQFDPAPGAKSKADNRRVEIVIGDPIK
ncbi:MAG: OmpA family protein [Planctomycetes bacterium]|jgi:flagellar motor protein MotB|nr:OmpA family protein [Planctomycetota bacterium]